MLVHQAQSVLALVSILILAASTNPAIFWTWILLSLLALLFAGVLLHVRACAYLLFRVWMICIAQYESIRMFE